MKLNFQVAEQWDELNEYQLSQISGLLFQKKIEEKELPVSYTHLTLPTKA